MRKDYTIKYESYVLKEIVLGRNKSVNICIKKIQIKGGKKDYKCRKRKHVNNKILKKIVIVLFLFVG